MQQSPWLPYSENSFENTQNKRKKPRKCLKHIERTQSNVIGAIYHCFVAEVNAHTKWSED